MIDVYAIEGHLPAREMKKRLLRERPRAAGLVVPGMLRGATRTKCLLVQPDGTSAVSPTDCLPLRSRCLNAVMANAFWFATVAALHETEMS